MAMVLVVEDDPDIRADIGDTLRDEGYVVELARDGSEAMVRLRRGAPLPDLILTDLVMPNMDGWRFRREQQADDALVQVPVLIMSAGADLAATAESLSVKGFLVKPFSVRALLDAVARAM